MIHLAGVRFDKIYSIAFLLKGCTCINHCAEQNKDLESLLSFRDSCGPGMHCWKSWIDFFDTNVSLSRQLFHSQSLRHNHNMKCQKRDTFIVVTFVKNNNNLFDSFYISMQISTLVSHGKHLGKSLLDIYLYCVRYTFELCLQITNYMNRSEAALATTRFRMSTVPKTTGTLKQTTLTPSALYEIHSIMPRTYEFEHLRITFCLPNGQNYF